MRIPQTVKLGLVIVAAVAILVGLIVLAAPYTSGTAYPGQPEYYCVFACM